MYDQIYQHSSIQFVVSGGIKDFDNIKAVADKGLLCLYRRKGLL